jgi:hypothetical protein
MPREVKKKLRRRRGQRVMVKKRMTPMSSHPSLLAAMGRGEGPIR